MPDEIQLDPVDIVPPADVFEYPNDVLADVRVPIVR